MPVPVKMADLFTIAASNSPAGSDPIGNSLDDYLRAVQAIIRSTNALSSSSVVASSTTDIGSSDAESVIVTGSATITSLGTTAPAGIKREVIFTSGGSVLTNSSSIVLPNSANITVNAGDVFQFRCLGSGNWRMVGPRSQLTQADVSGLLNTYLPLAGGTLTGALSGTSATFTGTVTAQSAGAGGVAVYVGNDASLWDVNIANTLGVYGQSDNTVGGVKLGSNGPTLSGSSTQLLINSTVHANGQINSDSTMSCIQGLVTMENATGNLQGLSITTSVSNAFNACYMAFNNTGKYAVYFGLGADNSLRVGGWSMGATSQRILHEGLSNAVLPSLTLGGGRLLTKITLANTAPGTLANGELYLQY